uniref:Lysophospholipid acyltransferase 5 n=1 Tax=Sinocyclocheilus rhinocerous TaxID=307959 RepID=A0A673IGK5_9TELE
MAAPFMEKLAEYLGSPEPAVRLILSILLGYPFALVYRWFLFHQSATVVHLFHTFSGLALATFNFGYQVCHSLLCVVIQFLLLRLMGRTVTCVLSSFVFQMIYLLMGYYYTATEEYDIKWTMPHCVLTLKLIGLALDYYDGEKEQSQMSAEQKKSALSSTPSLLEIFGFSYFYGGFLVGPQFTLRNYQNLVSREMSDAHPFWYKCVYILVWVKINLYKYISCWLITEGVCVLSGLGYNGKNEKGEHQWDACANVRVWLFETTPLFTGTINSFNINTNAWVARHVFKRLKFLGNKLLSQMFTLLFLAIWHGLHSGYLICFSLEFIIVNVEKQAQSLVRDSPLLASIAQSHLYPFVYVVQQLIHWLFMGYPLVPFCLFTYDKWLKVYSSIYFCGHIFFFFAFLVLPYLRKVFVPRKRGSEKKED